MEKPRVFIVHEPMKRQGDELVPVMDLTPAAEYGELIVCLSAGTMALTPGPMVSRLWEVLKDFNDEDFLVAVGDPTAFAVAASVVAAVNRGRYKMLKWNRSSRSYITVAVDLYPNRK